jgi:hypothetical protein
LEVGCPIHYCNILNFMNYAIKNSVHLLMQRPGLRSPHMKKVDLRMTILFMGIGILSIWAHFYTKVSAHTIPSHG